MSSYTTAVLADSPLAYYRLGETSGTTAHDSTTSGYNGTLNGTISLNQAGAIQGDTNGAMLFDGSTGYIALPPNLDLSTLSQLTIEFWLYVPSLSALNRDARVIANSHTDADNKGVQVVIAHGGLGGNFGLGNGTSNASLYIIGNDFVATTWYHIACTWDGPTMKLYINGVLNNSMNFPGPIASSGYPLNIGRNPAYTGDYFPGTLDEVAIYATALAPARVGAHYRAGSMHLVYTARAADMLLWAREYKWGNTATYNGELETYLPANVFQSGTELVLEGRNTGGGNPSVGGGTYTSGMVASYNAVSLRYGYLEASIKFPAGYGVWPAFWMLYTTYNANNEIDICEIFESATTLNCGIHFPSNGGVGSDGGSTTVPDMSAGYHTYAVDWQPTYIEFYFDGLSIRRITTVAEIPSQLMYILLNVAISGVAVGNHVPAAGQFPLDMYVQDVDIWQGYDAKTYQLSVLIPGQFRQTCAGRVEMAQRPRKREDNV